MDHTSGDWAKAYGYHWDCCAEIRERSDGTYSLLLWDEDLPKDNPLASAVIRAGEDCAIESWTFLDRELDAAGWEIECTRDAGGTLLTIRGEYEALGKGGFRCTVFLRPWGVRWPGSAEERPFSYETWYLPLIEADSPMPDKIG